MSLVPVDDIPVQILDIHPARKVDDDATVADGITAIREYNVITNGSKTELTIPDITADEPLFTVGRTFGGRRLTSLRLRETAADDLYILEAEFVPADFSSPLDEPVQYSWESASLEIPAFVDVDGNPIATTAGEPILGLTRNVKLWTIRATRNVAGIPSWFENYGVSVNSDIVSVDGRVFQPNQLQLQRISLGSEQAEEIDGVEHTFRELSFELWYNPLTWTAEVLNMGFSELVTRDVQAFAANGSPIVGFTNSVTRLVRANDGGDETTSRVFLDSSGRRPRNADGTIKHPLAPADIVVLEFDLEERLPYSLLVL